MSHRHTFHVCGHRNTALILRRLSVLISPTTTHPQLLCPPAPKKKGVSLAPLDLEMPTPLCQSTPLAKEIGAILPLPQLAEWSRFSFSRWGHPMGFYGTVRRWAAHVSTTLRGTQVLFFPCIQANSSWRISRRLCDVGVPTDFSSTLAFCPGHGICIKDRSSPDLLALKCFVGRLFAIFLGSSVNLCIGLPPCLSP